MRMGNTILQWIRLPKPPRTKSTMSNRSVKYRLRNIGGKNINISDKTYNIISTYDIMTLLKLHRFAELRYIPERRDCDDYSFSLAGLMKKLSPGICFGIVWADITNESGKIIYKHAFNFFINEKGRIMYVEPQTNNTFTPTKNVRPYLFIV